MSDPFVQRPIVPVGDEENAEMVTAALEPYLDVAETVKAVHVIQKAGGALDKASVEQREMAAQEIFSVIIDGLSHTEIAVETEVLYGTDVAGTIIDAAHESDATSIVFTPRDDSRWRKLLSGDVEYKLLNKTDVPILVLPDREVSEA